MKIVLRPPFFFGTNCNVNRGITVFTFNLNAIKVNIIYKFYKIYIGLFNSILLSIGTYYLNKSDSGT